MLKADGTSFWAYLTAVSGINTDTTPMLHLAINDISEQKLFEEKLELSASVFKNAGEAIMITDLEGRINDVNETFTKVTGYEKEEVLQRKPSFLSSGKHDKEFFRVMWKQLIEEGSWRGELWNKRKNKELFIELLIINTVYDHEGKPKHYVALFSDITALKEYEQSLKDIADYDQLTGLPNRVLLADRLLHGMIQTKRNDDFLAVIFLDLDGFKDINDTYGHDVGDKLLILLAKEMQDSLREGDTLARIGGDEFVAVLFDLADIAMSLPIITRLLSAAAKKVNINDLSMNVSASLGVTFYPQKQIINADQLLRQADQAMYQAKVSGKNCYHIFNAEENNLIRQRFEAIEEITQAFKNKEFVLYYQPKINMRSGKVIGAEALIRWKHSVRGIIAPMEFLPVIEEHALSNEIGAWVIYSALSQIQAWQEEGIEIPVSVNVGAHQLLEDDFSSYLKSVLSEFPSVKPSMLQIEVLETSRLKDLNHATEVMNSCIELGVSFALDDFGTGYSSLTYLEQLPIQQIKIDQSFVRDMLNDPKDLSIIAAIVSLSETFQHSIIAEGVETEELASILIQLGCELGQGYAFAKPMSSTDFIDWQKSFKPNSRFKTLELMNTLQQQLFILKLQHRLWLTNIQTALMDKTNRDTKKDLLKKSPLGLWMKKSGKEYLGDKFDEISISHHNVHTLASKLLEIHADGDYKEVVCRLDELNQLSGVFLSLLD
jgi:diguanylate cyclase (GGDEF)-like protein/PAS domain S-box-containing protein